MSSDTTLGAILAQPALGALARHTAVPAEVRSLMARAACRLADSDMVIGDSFAPFAIAPDSKVRTQMPQPDVLHAIAALIEDVREEGFGPHAARFFGLLGAIMIDLSGTPEQAAQVRGWVDQGLTACFAMTDAGGPLATDWRSVYDPQAGTATIDKVWSMNANRADFAIIILRQGRSMVLASTLIGPEDFARAERSQCGEAFLDGHLPLGNVNLVLETCGPGQMMTRGGPIGAKVFLTLARPWLIQALCAHLEWLERLGRVTPDATTRATLDFLAEAAGNQAALGYFDRFSEDQAMALKWIANECFIHLVSSGLVAGKGDQRDLMGFSKMEGSSYRCFFEIYTRNKRMRDAAA